MSDIHVIQDLARSDFSDMLLDDERNLAYDEAIRKCVQFLVNSPSRNPGGKKFFNCLDIGTGTGLLSMMVSRAFLSHGYYTFHVYAIEEFKPMAECASKTIEENGYSQYISVINNRSTEIRPNEIPKADLLVAELLDTELIGEGCLVSYRHAVENLCLEDCIFIPYKARIFVEPIESDILYQRNHICYSQVVTGVSDSVINCPGIAAVDDLHLDSLVENEHFQRFTSPLIGFEIVFNDLNTLKERDSRELKFPIHRRDYKKVVITTWWDLLMYDARLFTDYTPKLGVDYELELITCAPKWARSTEVKLRDKKVQDLFKREVWREHWIQGVYYLRNPKFWSRLQDESVYTITCYRDFYSLWFVYHHKDEPDLDLSDGPGQCVCGFHRVMSRNQIANMNDERLINKIANGTTPSCLSTVKKLIFKFNTSVPCWEAFDSEKLNPDTVPLFYDLGLSQEYPWSNALRHLMGDCQTTSPIKRLKIFMTMVKFENLQRTCKSVDKVMGFKLETYRQMTEKAREQVDSSVECVYLWEYECTCLHPKTMLFDSAELDRPKAGVILQRRVEFPQDVERPADGFGVVLWSELDFSETNPMTISTGPRDPSELLEGKRISWCTNARQQVYHVRRSASEAVEVTLYCDHLDIKEL